MPDTLLELANATVALGDRVVLRDRSFRLEAGERVALLGPNGSGKTTLLRVLSGELRAGALRVAGRPIASWSARELARQRAMLEQQPGCAWDLSVGELVALGGPGGREILARLGIAHLGDNAVAQLSGGERRVAHLARCLAQLGKPAGKILLLDEPDAGLDETRLDLVAIAIRRFALEGGAVVVATHSTELAEGMRVERV
jgi:iron complex transport system ATP-binding protein